MKIASDSLPIDKYDFPQVHIITHNMFISTTYKFNLTQNTTFEVIHQ